jgi:hypothetical protein
VRSEPASVLNERFAEVELHGSLGDFAPQEDRFVVLSEEAFGEAVRAALRDCANPHSLLENPLCRSRVVAEVPPHIMSVSEVDATLPYPATVKLCAVLKTAARCLEGGAKEKTLFQALHHTYLEPAPSQDIAAELVGLPFSTYRRHLAAAVARVTGWLWQREVKGWPHETVS